MKNKWQYRRMAFAGARKTECDRHDESCRRRYHSKHLEIKIQFPNGQLPFNSFDAEMHSIFNSTRANAAQVIVPVCGFQLQIIAVALRILRTTKSYLFRFNWLRVAARLLWLHAPVCVRARRIESTRIMFHDKYYLIKTCV